MAQETVRQQLVELGRQYPGRVLTFIHAVSDLPLTDFDELLSEWYRRSQSRRPPDFDVALASAAALLRKGVAPEGGREFLARVAYHEGDEEDYLEAAMALAIAGDSRAVSVLTRPGVASIRGLGDRVVETLCLCSHAPTLQRLRQGLTSMPKECSVFDAAALARVGEKWVADLLLRGLESDDPYQRAGGCRGLAFCEDLSIDPLLDCLHDLHGGVRYAASLALAVRSANSPEAVRQQVGRALQELLSPDWTMF